MKNFIRANIFFFFILFVICFAVYGKAMNFGITRLDDDKLTVNNINYISDYKNIPKFFKTDCYHASGHLYYRPILSLSFSLESMFFGYNTKVYHTTNILLFILSLFLIFVFLSKFNFNKNILKFLIVLCAVHPILASVPAWLPARNDSLLTIFLISSFIFFIKYLSSKKYSHLFLYLFFYALSVFTKETALIMIIIFPFLTILPFTNSPFRLKHKLCNSLCLAAIILFYFFMRYNSSVYKLDISFYFTNFGTFIKNIIFGTMAYIRYILFPNYMPILIHNFRPDAITIILSLSFFAALIFIYYKKIFSQKIILFSAVFFFISILPTFLEQEYIILFHRLVIVVPAILIILSLIIENFLSHYPTTKKYLILIFILLFTIYTYASFNQTDKYKNGLFFWTEAAKINPTYHVVYQGLGNEYMFLKEYHIAEILFRSAIKEKNSYDYNLNLATALIVQNKIDDAIEILLKLDKRKENATTLRYLSQLYNVKGEKEKAKKYKARLTKFLKGND